MKTKLSRMISLLVTLTLVLSCSVFTLSAFADDSAAEPAIETVFIGVDENASGASVSVDAESEISMNAGDALKLIAVLKPESSADQISAIEWRSERKNVADVDENGVVTTGPETGFVFRYFSLSPSVKIPVGFRFVGVTRIYLTVTDNNGELFYETVDLTVNHTFFDYLQWFFTRN